MHALRWIRGTDGADSWFLEGRRRVSGEMSALQVAFRSAMAGVCTPVSVVTTIEAGRPHGTTVSAFASLSMTPPMLSVSLDLKSDLLKMLRRTRFFGLNVLASNQEEVARRFARKGSDDFLEVQWRKELGAARLNGAAAWVACTVADIVRGGDHVVVLGNVVATESSPTDPLTYHDRTFGTHLRHADVS